MKESLTCLMVEIHIMMGETRVPIPTFAKTFALAIGGGQGV
jgi:hypothetical protein